MVKSNNNNDVNYIFEQINELRRLYNKANVKKMNTQYIDSRSNFEQNNNNFNNENNSNYINTELNNNLRNNDVNYNQRNIDINIKRENNLNQNNANLNDISLNDENRTNVNNVKTSVHNINTKNVNNIDRTIINVNKTKIKQKDENRLHNSKVKEILDGLENQINLLALENARLREEKLKSLADLENYKKMMQNELIDFKKYSIFNFAKELLPSIDNFERALAVSNTAPEVKTFLLGFEMINKSLKMIFANEGIVEIPARVGDAFNPNIHIGIETVETKTQKSGTITQILQKGYKLYDRVIRPVSVNVEK